MANDGDNPPAGIESSPARNVGHHHQQSKSRLPYLRAARALEAAAARRREERGAAR